MKVLITAVGQRTEHWTDLFAVMARQPGVEVTVAVADVSALTEHELQRHADRFPRFNFRVLPHLLSEARSGHMASVVIAPHALRTMDIDRPDVVHIIGEAAYLSTSQIIGWGRRRWPGIPVSLYAAQNIVIRFPIPFPWLERRAYAAVDHIFPITPAALKVLRSKGYRGDASIVPLGVDVKRFTPAPVGGRRPFTVGFVGRLETYKGIFDLLNAADTIDADVLLVGDGSQSAQVRQIAASRPGRVTAAAGRTTGNCQVC